MERETLKSTLYKLIRLGYTVHLEGMEDEKLVKVTLSKQNSGAADRLLTVSTIMSVEHLCPIYDHHPLGERFIVQILEDLQARLGAPQA